MLNLFIDTNIYLNFYHFSKEDLDKLGDLEKLINETAEIKLFVPSQVVDEYTRQREKVIHDALKEFDASSKFKIPALCKGYNEKDELEQAYNDFETKRNNLRRKISEDIKIKNLDADRKITNLFSASKESVSGEIEEIAKCRVAKGNPPGKKGSLGDAINWEFLLKFVPDREDLYVVTSDDDYTSALNKNMLSSFLLDEWQEKKNSNIYFYKMLNDFFQDRYPKLVLDDDYIKESRIKSFEESGSFMEARTNISELIGLGDFSDEQINRIVVASIANDQIYNAHAYSPERVGKKLETLIRGRAHGVEPKNYCDFCEKFGIAQEITDVI